MNSTVKNKEKLQNTKKIKDIVKRFSILTLSLMVIFSSFSLVFADSNTLLPVFDSKPTYDNMSSCPYVTYSGKNYYYGSTINNSYIFAFTNTSDNTYPLQAVVCSDTSFTYYQGAGSNRVVYTENVNNNTNGIYYAVAQNASSATFSFDNIGSFSSAADAVNYFYNLLTPDVKYPFTLQNGYLFVFDLGQSNSMYSFDLSSKSEEYSDIGSIPFPDTNQSYWFSNTLPEIDDTTIPDSSADIISWQKGNKTNIFGQTQDMIATISGTSTGRYLYIYNPPVHYKWSGSSNPTASETINYPIIINGVSENENWYIYDSVARLTDFNQGGSVTGTVTGEDIIGSVSSDGAISLITSSGAIYTQNSGGSTDISGANGGSIAENISGLKQTLDDFVNQFIQLLSAPISHIQQLIQSSNQFFDVFSQLFEWLPSELSSVIVSGLIIMVVIGVIKMLL